MNKKDAEEYIHPIQIVISEQAKEIQELKTEIKILNREQRKLWNYVFNINDVEP